MFEFLDKDNDGTLNYREFCGLAEEKRRNIDPYDEDAKNSSRNLESPYYNIKGSVTSETQSHTHLKNTAPMSIMKTYDDLES